MGNVNKLFYAAMTSSDEQPIRFFTTVSGVQNGISNIQIVQEGVYKYEINLIFRIIIILA
ncbi:hypothetical protein AVEN_57717-1, partial [Araneus ventricosus]